MNRMLALVFCFILFTSASAETGDLFGTMPDLLEAYLGLVPDTAVCTDAAYTAYYTGFDDDSFIDLESFFTCNCFQIEHFTGINNNITLHLARNSYGLDIAYDRSSKTAVISCPASLTGIIMHAPVQKGDIICFGSYEQDGNAENGPERIEWIVLNGNENSALLLSKYVLDAVINSGNCSNIWEDSEIRVWLNTVFYSTAFDSAERKQIKLYHATADLNPYYDTEQGRDTYDNVWLLSINEVEEYLPSKIERLAEPTPYVYTTKRISHNKGKVQWILRTVGNKPENYSVVNFTGSLYDIIRQYESGGIRPAVLVSLDTTEW